MCVSLISFREIHESDFHLQGPPAKHDEIWQNNASNHRMHRALEKWEYVSASSSSMVLSASLNSSCTIHWSTRIHKIRNSEFGYHFGEGVHLLAGLHHFPSNATPNILNDKFTDSFAHFVSSVCVEGSLESELETDIHIFWHFCDFCVLVEGVVLIMVEDFQGNCGLVKHGARYVSQSTMFLLLISHVCTEASLLLATNKQQKYEYINVCIYVIYCIYQTFWLTQMSLEAGNVDLSFWRLDLHCYGTLVSLESFHALWRNMAFIKLWDMEPMRTTKRAESPFALVYFLTSNVALPEGFRWNQEKLCRSASASSSTSPVLMASSCGRTWDQWEGHFGGSRIWWLGDPLSLRLLCGFTYF